MRENRKVKIAIIGAGYMAREHIIAFRDLPNIELAGIYSRTNEKAEALALKYQIKNVSHSIEDLYHSTHADLVVIAVPVLSVKNVCHEVFKYPWISLIEKPVGYNYIEAEMIAIDARQQGANAYVALNRRCYSSTQSVLDEITCSDAQRFIHVLDQEDMEAAAKYGVPELVIDNLMYANAIHVIDYFQLFGRGEITNVENVIQWNPVKPFFVLSKITFSSGDIGIYEAVWNAPGPWAVSVSTQEKRWELRPLEQATFQEKGSRKINTIKTNGWDLTFKPGLRVQAAKAIKAVHGETHDLVSLDDALNTMKLIRDIYV